MSGGVNWLLTKEIKEAIDEGVIDGMYSNFNEPSISELERRMKALDEIETYVVVKTLVKYRRELFVNILEYLNKKAKEGE
jgi:predicted hydrolase (HD superfamily)